MTESISTTDPNSITEKQLHHLLNYSSDLQDKLMKKYSAKRLEDLTKQNASRAIRIGSALSTVKKLLRKDPDFHQFIEDRRK